MSADPFAFQAGRSTVPGMTKRLKTDFVTLKKARTPNSFLMAPDGLCQQSRVDEVPAVYGVTPQKLRQAFLKVAKAQPRVVHDDAGDASLYDELTVRSALFGFPDLVSIQFLDVKGGKSTLAIYSRSVYGRSDLGVNRARTMAWIRLVNDAVKPDGA